MKLLGSKTTFGKYDRYAIALIHTDADEVLWYVWDAESAEANRRSRYKFSGFAEVIRQERSFRAALRGLADMGEMDEITRNLVLNAAYDGVTY